MGTSHLSARDVTPAASAEPLLALDRVTTRRPNGRSAAVVLDGVTFDIAPGEHLGVRGPRRSGKTTLLRIAAGLDLPDEGSIAWRGVPVGRLSARRRTRRLREIAFVAPSADWRAAPGKPMLDHVALPLVIAGTPVTDALLTARLLAEQVGADDFVDALPHELPPDLLVRLALARALVRDPYLLIVDELGGGGDDSAQQSLQQLLLALARDRPTMALLVSSREASLLRGLDRIMSLDGSGRLRVPDRDEAQVLRFPSRGPGE